MNQVRDTVVPMFMAIMDDDEAEAEEDVTPKSSHWRRYQNNAHKRLTLEEIKTKDGKPGKRQLMRYRFRDHLRVGLRTALESLVLFPFWAVKVRTVFIKS